MMIHDHNEGGFHMKRKTYLLTAILCMVISLAAFTPVGSCEENALPDPETVYQVALLQSLAQGHFDGMITVGELKAHGDTGIGTFDGLNGEMIVLDGVVYQAIGDGSIVIPPDSETVPFSNVTFFEEDLSVPLNAIQDMATLQATLNEVVDSRGRNLFYVVVQCFGQNIQNVDIAAYQRKQIRPLHLNHHPHPAFQHRTMHLRNRCRPNRLLLN